MQTRVTLLVLAALCGAAMAREPPMSPAGRELLQGVADCARSITNCNTCRYQKFGTTTLTICSQCSTGYTVKSGGRACMCAPGYKYSGSACVICTASAPGDSYCPGSTTTLASAIAIPCGAHKQTISTVAKSERECVAKPGYGWALTDAVECPAGSYNPGMNNRACTKCPGGLTTANVQSTSASACVAPKGSYYYRGRALACAKGYFKAATGNVDCDHCPVGFTTPGVGSYAAGGADCSVLQAGYFVASGAALGTVVGTPCPVNTWAAGGNYVSGTTTCTACLGTCVTSPDLRSPNPAFQDAANAPGATSAAMCVAPPGHDYRSGICSECDVGSYNPGYNREACTSCGTNFQGRGNSSDACMIPAGSGTTRDTNGALTVALCPANTYGRNTSTYGLVDVECTKCIDNTETLGTPATGKTTPEHCVTKAGYGYDDGAVNVCDYGYYAGGGTQNPCTYCGDGLTTDTTGAILVTECKTAPGWTGTFGVDMKACPVGTYKSTTGPSACTDCPVGLSTTVSAGATARANCDICIPGYGAAVGADITTGSTTCAQCASGTFYGGRVQNGTECSPCPFPDGVDFAVMVSKPGSLTPESCVRQFPTGNSSLSNGLEWDIITMGSLAVQSTPISDSLIACQEGCAADTQCQYFVWNTTAGAATTSCAFRRVAVSGPPSATDLASGSTYWVMFEVKEGQYVAYPAVDAADTAAIGTDLGTYASYTLAKTACDLSVTCIGFAGKSGAWRTFSGTKWEGTIGKVRVKGANINSWIQ